MRKMIVYGILALALSVGGGRSAMGQQSSKPPKIGVLTDMSSYVSPLAGQGSVIAAQMAVEDYENATGHKVDLVYADSQAKPDIASAIARRWYDLEGVDLIADLPPSSVALAVQSLAKERGKIAIFSAASALDLVGKQCSETGFQWAYNTVAIARVLASAVVKQGGRSWFFIVQDNAYGLSLEEQARRVILANGGSVLGVVRTPTDMTDFSSALLQAQSSGAEVVAIGNSGSQASVAIKQAKEYELDRRQRIVGLSLLLTEVRSIGLALAQGLLVSDSFYWNFNDRTVEWSKRFALRYSGRMPTSTQAGVYSAITHYLKARDASASTDGKAVANKMREIPVDDFMTDKAKILNNGWVERKFYLYQIKKPSESTSEWDLFEVVREVPGDSIAPRDFGCPLEKQ